MKTIDCISLLCVILVCVQIKLELEMVIIIDIDLATTVDMGWCWYHKEGRNEIPHTDGKFMTFGEGMVPESIQQIIIQGVDSGVVPLVKHTHPMRLLDGGDQTSWVTVWYCNDDRKSLQKLAAFLNENGLIPRTKSGRLYNISYKYDAQTKQNEYGENFKPKITLSELMDLNTGQLLP